MAARPLPLLPLPLVAAATVLSAALVGVLTAASIPLGVAVAIGIFYAPLVLLNLQLGVALWVLLMFVEFLPAVRFGPAAALALVAAGWLGTLRLRRASALPVLADHRLLPGLLVALAIWLALSVTWANDADAAVSALWSWLVAIFAFVVVVTMIERPEHLRWVISAFVAGAVISVLTGLGADVTSGSATADSATQSDGRLVGGGADPNYLAAGLVPAIVLAGALAGWTRKLEVRWLLIAGAAVATIGLAATQSRGGFVAALAVVAAALLFLRGQRVGLAVFLAVAATAGAAFFAVNPAAWERVSDFSGGGTGRTDVWTVGWRAFEDNPVGGLGLDNFRSESARYAREPGELQRADIVVERRAVTHNTYLQLLTETGIVGLLLFASIAVLSLLAAWRAARRFAAVANTRWAWLARGALVGSIGGLTASFFLTNGADKRLWVLLALGPVLDSLSRREPGLGMSGARES